MFGAEAFPKMTTGTDLVPASSRMLTTTNGSVVEPMSPMDSIREMFIDMRDSLQQIVENTLKTNDLLQTAVLGTPAEQRDQAIAAGETDSQGNDLTDDDQGPGFFQRLTDRVTGMGTFGKFLLAIGALVGLKLFGDNLVPSLAKLLETIKKGELTKKIEDTLTLLKDSAMVAFDNLKTGVEDFIIGVRNIVGVIQDLYTRIEDFTEGFDIEKTIEKLKPIAENIKNQLIESIGAFAKELLLGIGGALLGLTFINQAVKLALANPALKAIFAGKPLAGAALTKAALSAGTIVPIAGLLLYGISTTYTNITNSIAKTIEEEGSFKFGPFLANFFGGEGEGGWFNALKQAFKIGGPFALSGMAIGAAVMIGTGPGALVGALIGGLVGTAVGAVIGAFTGYLGSDKLKEFGSALKGTIDSAIDYIKNFFTNLINDVKRLLGFQTDPALDLSRAQKNVAEAREKLATNPDYMPYVKALEKAEAELAEELAAQPLKQAEAATGLSMSSIENQIKDEQAIIDRNNMMLNDPLYQNNPAIDQEALRKEITEANERINDLNAQKLMLQTTPLPSTGLVEDLEIQNKIKEQETSMMGAGSIGSGGIVTKIDNSNTAIKGGDNITVTGLSSENSEITAMLLAIRKARMT